ncbi:Iron-sulfur cluster insertion protein ErpA [Buchnera aphidicola (Eriosoma grossulariae)]|uniref:iron-sulfur cluster insertion protein ErpA n=1 Tax=Buchnera aphidicola TaxID=9 RepID=UPI0034638B58
MNNLDIPIDLSNLAAEKVKDLIKNQENKNIQLRIYITGGGCSGFQYNFIFDRKIKKDDHVIEKLGVKILIDAITLQYLIGGKIDYQENLEGSKFIIINPNAKTTCGCGLSFSI